MKLGFINICKYAIGLIFIFCIVSLPSKVFAREDMEIVRVGADGLTSSAPAGTQSASPTGGANTSSNPAYFTDIYSDGANGNIQTGFVAVTDLPDYNETIALCTYSIGSASCNVSASDFKPFWSYPNSQCYNNAGGQCMMRTNVYPGMVTKAVIKYTQGPQVKIVRVGADGLLTSAPATSTTLGVDASSNSYYGNATTSANPVTVGSIDPYWKLGFGASKNLSYMQTIGICTYPIGSTECNIPLSAFTSTLDCNNNSVACTTYRSFDPGYVTKLAFRYEAIASTSLTSTYVFTRVGPDGTISSVPSNTTMLGSFSATATSSNPVQVSSTLYSGAYQYSNYSISVTDKDTYTESFGVCTYPVGSPSCSVPNAEFIYVGCYNNQCNIQGGGNYTDRITKVVARYEPSPQVKFYRVGADGLTTSSPNYTIFYQDVYVSTTTSDNPFLYTSIRGDSFSYQSQDLPWYRKTFAYCTYTVGSTECNVQASDFQDYACGPGIGCVSTWQRIPPLTATKIVLKYVPVPSLKVTRVGTDGLATSVPPGTTAKLDSGVASSSNSADFYNVSTGSAHTITVTDIPGYQESVGSCTYNEQSLIGCTVPYFLTSSSNITCNGTTCSIPQSVTAGYVTKVDVKYTPVGDVKITRYGSDGASTSTAPMGTWGRVDSMTASTTNPSYYTNIATGSHTASATDVSGYTEMIGTCTYAVGGTECTIPTGSFSTSTVTCASGSCSIPVTVSTGQVTKVGVKYISNIGDIQVSRYGSDGLATSTAPAGTQGKVNALTASSTNPSYFRGFSSYYPGGGIFSGVNDVYSTNLAGYAEMYGTCTYPIGGTECTVASSSYTLVSTYDCTQYTGMCGSPIVVYAGQVSKMAIKYIQNTGSIQITRYGSDLGWPSTAPAGTQGSVGTSTASSTNPSIFTNVAYGTQTTYATDMSGYTETMGTCTYTIGGTECTIASSSFSIIPTCTSGMCSTSVTVSTGQVTKVGVRYAQDTGNIQITRYGSDLGWPSTAPAGTQGRVDTLSASSTNPSYFTGLTPGAHTVYVTDVADYEESFGSCVYTIGAVECEIQSNQFSTTSVSCTSGLCSINDVSSSVVSGQATKVGVKYVANIAIPTTPTAPTASSACNAGYTAADITVSWGPSSNATNYKVYRATTSGGAGTLIASPVSSPYVDSGLVYGQTYYYSVSASNSGGDSAQTSQVQVTTQSSCTGTCTNGAPNPYPLPNGINYPACNCPLGPEVNGTCTSTSTIAVVNKFVANPNTVNRGSSCNIQVNVSDSSGCTISGTNGDTFSIPVSSNPTITSRTSSQIQDTTKFTLTCIGVGKGLDGNDLITNKEALCTVNSIIIEK